MIPSKSFRRLTILLQLCWREGREEGREREGERERERERERQRKRERERERERERQKDITVLKYNTKPVDRMKIMLYEHQLKSSHKDEVLC